MKRIILIEDSRSMGSLIKNLLENRGLEVIWLKTFDEAFDYLNNFKISDVPSVEVIIFDYMLDEHNFKITSVPLVEMMRDMGYSKPMIANSSDEDFNTHLRQVGCTHIRPGHSKVNVVDFLHKEILDRN